MSSPRVLWLALLVACSPVVPGLEAPEWGSAPPDPGAPRIAGLTLSVTPPVPGDTLTVTVTGAGAFEQIQVARSLAGPGSGPCFGTLSALCLDVAGPIALHATLTADAGGVAVLEQTLPETLPIGTNVVFQAVIPRGTSGLNWAKSNVVTTQIEDAPLHAGAFQPGDLRVTEVLVDPVAVSDGRGEWFELHNVSGVDANLDGLVLSDGSSVFSIIGTTFVADGERLVFGASTDRGVNGGAPVDRAWSGLSLANDFGEVAVLDGPVVVDVVGWDDGASFPLQAGRSLTLAADADHTDNDLGSSWCPGDTVFGAGDRGTPGATNDSCEPLVLQLSSAAAQLNGNGSEGIADAMASADLDGDGFGDLIVTSYNYSPDGSSNAGSTWIVYGPVVGAFDIASATGRLDGVAASDLSGTSVAAVGDVDGDGGIDLLVGAPYGDDTLVDVGVAYLITEPVVGPTSLSTAHARLIGEATYDEAGDSVARAGDLDGDGFDDLLIGAPYHDTNGTDAGVAYVVHGPVVGDFDLANADARLFGENPGDGAGDEVVGVGDVNGDGVPDLAVTAPRDSTEVFWGGAIYLVHGPVAGDHDLGVVASGILRGDVQSGGWDLEVARVGDVDADGYDDLLVGSVVADAAYLFYGPITGERLLSEADATFTLQDTYSDSVGSSVAGPGDLNGDGHADLLIGASNADRPSSNSGAAFVVYGPVYGDVDLDDADVILQGSGTSDYAGEIVAGAGDMDGDGLLDLAVGSYWQGGTVWVMSGREL